MNPTKMSAAKQQYAELLALSQLYLSREYGLTDKCPIDAASLLSLKPFLVKKGLTAPKPIAAASNTPPPTVLKPHEEKRPPVVEEPVSKPATLAEKIEETPLQTVPTAPKKTLEIKEKKQWVLEPFSPPEPRSADPKWIQYFNTHFPHYPLCEHAPSDQQARKIKETWLLKQQIPPILLLSFQEDAAAIQFLKHTAKAISIRFTPARVFSALELEKSGRWEEILSTPGLRLVIASDYGLYLEPGLMKYYQQGTQSPSHLLNGIPLLLLSEISLYMKKPELKPLLWNAICNELKK